MHSESVSIHNRQILKRANRDSVRKETTPHGIQYLINATTLIIVRWMPRLTSFKTIYLPPRAPLFNVFNSPAPVYFGPTLAQATQNIHRAHMRIVPAIFERL